MTTTRAPGRALALLLAVFAAAAPGRGETVTIYRDTYGVPHIAAETNPGVLYGFGYAQAEDHLLAMLANYVRASGRLCEFFGIDDPELPGPDNHHFVLDLQCRLCKIREIAEERYDEIAPETRAMLEAFAAGINAFIDDKGRGLPEWARRRGPVTGVDVVAFQRWYQWSVEWGQAMEEAGARAGWTAASNGWAVGATRTACGAAMVGIDPHVPWSVWTRMYEAHLRGGDFDVSGAAIYGTPFLCVGHSATFACASTANTPDLADVYIEACDKSLSRYLFDGEWHPVISDPTVIKILGSAPVEVPRFYTHGGRRVVFAVDAENQRALSARLVSMDEVHGTTQSLRLNMAADLAEFKDACAQGSVSSGNAIFGDTQGNIYYLYNARQPLKDAAIDWTRPVDGTTSATEWHGFMEFEDLPQVENPPSDYLINNNVAPWHVTEGCGIDPAEYPPYLFRQRPDGSGGPGNGFRQLRAAELIASDPSLTADEMKSIALDTYIVPAEWAMPLLEASVNDPVARQYAHDPLGLIDPAFQLLCQWDRRAVRASTGTMLFSVFYGLCPAGLSADDGQPDPGQLNLWSKIAILSALGNAAAWADQTYGALDVPWGDVHKLARGGLEFPLSGSNKREQTLKMATIDRFRDKAGFCNSGSSYMMLAVLTSPVQAFSMKPFGQSENPASPHFADLTALYSNDQFRPAWFTNEEILAHLESVTVLAYSSGLP